MSGSPPADVYRHCCRAPTAGDANLETERERLLAQYAEQPTPDLLERLVVSYLPLAHALAHRYCNGTDGDADLEQAACEGLVKAVRRFDPQRGRDFTAFAVPTILGQVRRYIRDTRWPAHVPRPVQERALAVRAASTRLSAELGRRPSVREIGCAIGCDDGAVVDALLAISSTAPAPLDAPPDAEPERARASSVGAEDPGFSRVEEATALLGALRTLDGDEQTVVRLYFGDELTQRQIAGVLGCSRSHVGRLMATALDQLRLAYGATGPAGGTWAHRALRPRGLRSPARP